MAKPEIRLVERAKAGDAEAFGQLYAQYAQDLYRFAYYYLGSREEAEDAVQDAICAAFQGVGALRSAASFRAWLFSILANTCKHHIAAVKERRLTTPLEEARRLGEGECSEALALALELREAIYALSDEERSIVLLFVIDLSDTGAPKILGKLKIPGFSSYLHPVGENLLLGIGQDTDLQGTTRGVKLSLFDVSNPAKPREIDSLILPNGTHTDAPSEYKSILFLPGQNSFALPIYQEEFDQSFHAYYRDYRYCIFSIQKNQIKLQHTLRNYTKEELRSESYSVNSAILRGTYIGDTLYTFSNGRVCAFSLSSGQKLGQLDF